MSVQFGIWNYDGASVEKRLMKEASAMLKPFAGDSTSNYSIDGVGIVYSGLHATIESRTEEQPYVAGSGCVFVWDGRLDNREQLIRGLGSKLEQTSSDVEIVAEAFDQWGGDCFSKLIGDWAVSVWDPPARRLLLAKDVIGSRSLYYWAQRGRVWWSSILNPLVLLSGDKFRLNEEYLAGWMAIYPATHATPYQGILAVEPACFVTVTQQGVTTRKYWEFDPGKRIRYRSDAEYEEHFRSVFREAVRRRLRTDRTICAELSGGMDSPSVTCMADLIAKSDREVSEIVTLSYYNDTEPNANEAPFFQKVEEQRGRTGCHINIAGAEVFDFAAGGFPPTPGEMGSKEADATRQSSDLLASRGIRVVLSGLGGDEVMGGVPSPTSELQDLLVQCRFAELAHKLMVWALNKRKPWFYLLGDAIAEFLPNAVAPTPTYRQPAPWLTTSFVKRHRHALGGFSARITFGGGTPSFQNNLAALDAVRRQLATKGLPKQPAHERRYPFLDRDLLEFLYAIPREQLLRPGYRRSLMRRAMTGIVPAEVLGNPRKAYASRGPRIAISREWTRVSALADDMVAEQLGIVDGPKFRKALLDVRSSERVPLIRFLRTIIFEAWLRKLREHQVLLGVDTSHDTRGRTLVPVRV